MNKAADSFEESFGKRIVLSEQAADRTLSFTMFSLCNPPDLLPMDMDFLINKNEVLFFATFLNLILSWMYV